MISTVGTVCLAEKIIVDTSLVSCMTFRIDIILIIDPQGRPTVTVGSDHCFCTCRPFVRLSPLFKTKQNLSKNNVRYWLDCGFGRVDH